MEGLLHRSAHTPGSNEGSREWKPWSGRAERPGTVTLIVVLAWIGGILNILGGIFVIIDRHDVRLRVDSAHTPNELLAWGIAAIIIGAIYCLLASALSRGSADRSPRLRHRRGAQSRRGCVRRHRVQR